MKIIYLFLITILLLGCGGSVGSNTIPSFESLSRTKLGTKTYTKEELQAYIKKPTKSGTPKIYVQSGGTSIVKAAYSKDNKILVTIDYTHTLYIWDVQTAKELKRIHLQGLGSIIRKLSFTDKKNHLFIGTYGLKQVNSMIVLDIDKEEVISKFDIRSLYSMPEYSSFLYTSQYPIRKYNIYNGNYLSHIPPVNKDMSVSTISQSGKYIVSKSHQDNDFYKPIYTIHDTENKFIPIYRWHTNGNKNNVPFSASISNNGEYLYLQSTKKSVLINLKSNQIIRTRALHRRNKIRFSKDSKIMYSSNSVDGLSALNINTLKSKHITKAFSESLEVPLNANSLLYGENLINLDTLKVTKRYAHNLSSRLTSYIYNGQLKLNNGSLNIDNFNKFHPISLQKTSSFKFIDFQHENYIVQVDKKDILKSIKTQEILLAFDTASRINIFSPDGKYLLRQTINRNPLISINMQLWNIESKTLIHTFHNSQLRNFLFKGNGYIVLNSIKNSGKEVELFNIATKSIEFEDLVDTYQSVLAVSDKYYVLSNKSKLFFVNASSNEVVHTFDDPNFIRFVSKARFTPDNKYLIMKYKDVQYIYNIEKNFKKIKIDLPRDFGLNNLNFSKDSKFMSISGANYTSLYNLDTKDRIDVHTFGDKEWIALTQEGYFNGSDGVERHLRVRHSDGSISSLAQYYAHYYRPDIVAKAMDTKDRNIHYAGVKLNITDIKLAPSVKIINTQQNINKEELKVTLSIIPSSGGIGQIRLYIDGVLVKTDGDRGLKIKQSKNNVLKSYTLKIPQGEHTIKAIVFNATNTMESKAETLSIYSTFQPINKPNIHAIVIGINEYNNPSIALKYAIADANVFAEVIKANTKDLYGNVKIELLTTKHATTKMNISKKLKELESISPNDLFIFFVASHGMIEDAKYYMVTSNVGSLSSRGIKKEALSQESLRDMIANIPTTKKFIVLDTCNSGALGQAIEVALLTRGLTEVTAMKVLSRAVGSTIISASSSSQEALEGYKGHGLLTYVLTQGLQGKADTDGDGYVKTLELANYIEDTVPEIAQEKFNRIQYPFISPHGQGFPLVRIKK